MQDTDLGNVAAMKMFKACFYHSRILKGLLNVLQFEPDQVPDKVSNSTSFFISGLFPNKL